MEVTNSSQLNSKLFKDYPKYSNLLKSHIDFLCNKYKNVELCNIFKTINDKFLVICPMALCDSLARDLNCNVNENEIIALGLHMVAISTHDDAVDEICSNRKLLSALIYSGNIVSNEANIILMKSNNIISTQILLEYINKNHFYQNHVINTLWQKKPNNFDEYLDGIAHVRVCAKIGLFYAISLCNRFDLIDTINLIGDTYGNAIQILDDIREVENDKQQGYNSYPIVEGYPYTESIGSLRNNIAICKSAISPEWINMKIIIDNLDNLLKEVMGNDY